MLVSMVLSDAYHITSKVVCVCVCVCVCVTGGHRKCFDLQPNATTSLDDGDCRPQKGYPVRWQP